MTKSNKGLRLRTRFRKWRMTNCKAEPTTAQLLAEVMVAIQSRPQELEGLVPLFCELHLSPLHASCIHPLCPTLKAYTDILRQGEVKVHITQARYVTRNCDDCLVAQSYDLLKERLSQNQPAEALRSHYNECGRVPSASGDIVRLGRANEQN